ncbi:beta-glucosidase [Actinopolyspora xinjiangensis]|uniref:Beta-glucosidase n=1 Tax=Actinopolyspora xinjiangensis TaxID=405564 RepID=A0A1H0UFU3_9ACTN|nr:glycoside hydrolase family 3 C-terminal domain-containing protein [Actinopolyspora xinjiangensis]SDP64746.1 beta-glucosidase [Actinopolyspora xinjiangensis]
MEPPHISQEHVEELLGRLDLERKVRLISGAGFWHTPDEPVIGLRGMFLSDGPSGVRGEFWDERDPSSCLPSPTALAATWDEESVVGSARVLAAEARRKGVDVVLGPTINLHRSPLGGRHFECFSEDPLLTGRIAGAYIGALQDAGVAATAKHYVANDSETERYTVDVEVDERTLRELYLAPFERAVAAGAWLVMSGYNGVNGHTMTEHPLLEDPLRTEWGFDGVVVSDWTAVRTTEAAAAGNDLAMPGPSEVWGAPLLAAIRDGRVPEAAVDDKVRRIIRLAARVGALDDVVPRGLRLPEVDRSRALRSAAADSMVLLRNEGELLPLRRSRLGRLAVLGPSASASRVQGGGSSSVVPEYAISPLEGLRTALGSATEVVHREGVFLRDELEPVPVDMLTNPVTGQRGVRVCFRDAHGEVLAAENRGTARLMWTGAELSGVETVEVSTTVLPTVSGTHELGVAGVGPHRLEVDGSVVLERTLRPERADPAEAVLAPPHATAEVELEAGSAVDVLATHRVLGGWLGAVTLGLFEPAADAAAEFAGAVAAASEADAAVIVVGTTARTESEGSDRDTLELPGGQRELVRAVAEANPHTVVVVNSGAPVELDWHEEVPAVLLSWFPGQEGGNALADVLLGDREPGGRLPSTWPVRQRDVPVLDTRPDHGRLEYAEGPHIGYRAWRRSARRPAYSFGHGLGYTRWEYTSLLGPERFRAGDDVLFQVGLTNTGERHGKEVVQLYLRRAESEVDRPELWLAGFAVVEAAAGAQALVPVRLEAEVFRHWDRVVGGWSFEPGTFTVLAGHGVADLPLRTEIQLDTPTG